MASQKICPLEAGKVQNNLPVDRPVARPNSHFSDRCASDRPPGRPGQAYRSTAQSTVQPLELGAFSRSTVRSTGLLWLACARPSCILVDRSGRPTPGPVDRPVDRQSSVAWDL